MPQINCPHCGHSNEGPITNGGGVAECAACGRAFALPVPATRGQQSLGPPAASRLVGGPMPLGGPTDVSPSKSGSIALGVTLVFYLAIVLPLGGTYFGELFGNRGWVPYFVTWFTSWSLVILTFKLQLYRHQLDALELDLLPVSLSERITPGNAHIFASYLQHLASNGPRSFLVQRLQWATRRYGARGDVRDLTSQLNERARADADAVDSSYSMLRVFIWAIPILGFIGTVLGIGNSVSGFSQSVAGAADLEVMKQSIGSVTTGLGVAFDTTLLALVMSILVMFPTSALQKAEEDFLARCDDYCDEHLICRLSSAQPTAPMSAATGAAPEPVAVAPPPPSEDRIAAALSELEQRIARLEPSSGQDS